MKNATAEHNQLIVDQFTRMAAPFAEMPEHSDEQSLRLLLDSAGVGNADHMLDVCCGTGIVACAAAGRARHVTGVDITAAMIEQAKRLQARQGLQNLSWNVGDVATLPFADEAFSVVLSRYAFHHLLDPQAVLKEMARVCQPGGRVAVADVFTTSALQDRMYNRVEKLRDASHARALGLEEFRAMFAAAGLSEPAEAYYRLDVDLETLLESSCTPAGDANEVRQLLSADIDKNETGMKPRWMAGKLRFSFPVVVLVGVKQA